MVFVIRNLAIVLLAMVSTAVRADDRAAPFPAHRITGNVYYVGTADYAAYLITTPGGHFLINTGGFGSASLIRKSIENLGFKLSDVKILTTMQAHWDHVAGLAELKKQSGGKVYATEQDAVLLEDGGASDYLLGKESHFPPVKVDRRLQDGEKISLGGTELTVHVHPGHTKGSASFTLVVNESGRKYNVAILNMGSVNPGTVLVNNPKYPNIATDYAETFRKQKALACEVFLSAHGSHYGLMEKYKPGQKYDPAVFVDPQGCKARVAEYEDKFLAELARQKKP